MSPEKAKQLVAQRVRDLRKEQGLSGTEFANLIGKSPSWLSDFEHGKYNSTVETLNLMAEALGLDICDLFVFPERNVRHQVFDLTREVSEDSLHDTRTFLIRAREDRKQREERFRRIRARH
jgi:transcriptional regulator with XRE-family HTH domain